MADRMDGGPAFPTENAHQTGTSTYHYQGMSLRDYLAAHAMSGLVANERFRGASADVAEDAYRIADAMLATRSAPTEKEER